VSFEHDKGSSVGFTRMQQCICCLQMKRPLMRSICRQKDNEKMDLRERRCKDMDWICLGQDKVQ
jgi:hypothetical protein